VEEPEVLRDPMDRTGIMPCLFHKARNSSVWQGRGVALG
jgi:hypothetical protein